MITLQNEYQHRRKLLAAKLSAESIAIIPSARECLRNGDAHYRFRQSSFFYYLTGFNEPDALLLLEANGTCHLFNRPRDLTQEQWTGPRLGQELAKSQLHVQESYNIATVDQRLPDLLANRQAIYYTFGHDELWDQRILTAYRRTQGQLRRGVQAPYAFYDILNILSEMRLFKSEAELLCMQEAARLSVAAHQQAMYKCRHLKYEYQLEAVFLNHLHQFGCRDVAYDSIVASGKNACVLHYTANNQLLEPNSLVLIDAGGEYQNYAADITRTYPVNGTFSLQQRLIYELVLEAQAQGRACLQPGTPWNKIQQAIINTLTRGLVDLGILKGSIDALIEQQAYRPFYMHGSGHWLGLDVHDVGAYQLNKLSRPLLPGMVLTVEPGLYLSPSKDLDPQWWNIGVRIEDDFLITQTGHTCLTIDLPTKVADIERCMRDGA